MKEPTVHDVALLAQVSIGTVSNVLNGRASVRQELVVRVTEAAAKLGYFRNSNAAGLRSNQTDMIAVAVPNIENAFFAEIVTSIEHLGMAERKGVMFLTTSEDQERAQRQIHNLISRRIDGLIIVASFDVHPMIPDLEKYGVPVVLVDRVEAENPFPSVAVDNFQAGYLGGRHLFEAGYSHVAFFGHGLHFWNLNQRHEGFLEAARQAGRAALCQSYEVRLDPEDIKTRAMKILGRKKRPHAIFASSNIAAKGIMFFSAIDQSQLAAGAGIPLRPSTLLIFGNPPLGTQFMTSNPYSGLDWPVRLLVIQDEKGDVYAVYTDFGWIAKRHGITDRMEQFDTANKVVASITSTVAK